MVPNTRRSPPPMAQMPSVLDGLTRFWLRGYPPWPSKACASAARCRCAVQGLGGAKPTGPFLTSAPRATVGPLCAPHAPFSAPLKVEYCSWQDTLNKQTPQLKAPQKERVRWASCRPEEDRGPGVRPDPAAPVNQLASPVSPVCPTPHLLWLRRLRTFSLSVDNLQKAE